MTAPAGSPALVARTPSSRTFPSAWSTAGWWAAVGGLAVIAYGLVWLPYYGDQALYAVIGRDVLAGRPLYTGIWDIKQPGIFLWYGLLGGIPAVTRTADVLVALGTALLVGRLLAPSVGPRAARWAPVVAAAALLLPVRALDLGQVEQLVLLPATAALLLAVRGRPFPAGLLIGVVAVFKLWAAAVPLAAVLIILVLGTPRTTAKVRIGQVLLGAALPLAAVLCWLAATGSLGAALDTWFVTPAGQLAQPGARTFGRLAAGAGRYALLMAPLLLLAAARLPRVWRQRDPLDLALVGWLVAALAVIGGQLWWSYHWLLLTPAVVALAVRQVADLATDPHRMSAPRARLVAAVLGLASVPLLLTGLLSSERPLVYGNGVTAHSRAALAAALGSGPAAQAELAAAGVRPGESLYVLGDPTYQLVHGTPIPVRLAGWSPELFTDAQWTELAADLDRSRPRWVFLENDTIQLAARRSPALELLFADHGVRVRSSPAGDWYRLESGRP